MKRTLLYYPKIAIENPRWLRQSILYWDEVGSIVPNGEERKAMSSREVQILKNEGVYRPFVPEHYVRQHHEVADEFRLSLPPLYKIASSVATTVFSLLFSSKVNDALTDHLVENSYAIRERDRLRTDQRSAMLYMSLLAKHMANDDKNSITTPGTDVPAYLDLVYPNTRDGIPGASLTLENILPVPTEDTQIRDILKFKERRKDELFKFRAVLYEHQDKLKQVEDHSQIVDLNSRFVETMQVELSNLGSALRGDGLQFRLGTLKNIFTLSLPSLISSLAERLTDETRITISVAGTIAAGAVIMGEHFFTAHNAQQKTLAANSYSYLYNAKEEGII